MIAVGISRTGIDFNSLDGQPVRFIYLMISCADTPYLILQAMSAIIRFMSMPGVADRLFEKKERNGIAQEFKNDTLKAHEVIRARDIMRPIKVRALMQMSVEEVSRLMHLYHLDVLPVVDEAGKPCGQISCFEIFNYGIPDFFKHLHTVSFVRHIDPFEKYFKIKRELKVSNIVDNECDIVLQDATLVEVIFQLTVKNKPKLFVIKDNGVLIGEIDRFSIIDKILFF